MKADENGSRHKSEERLREGGTGMEVRGNKGKSRKGGGGGRLAVSYCESLPTARTLEKLLNRYN